MRKGTVLLALVLILVGVYSLLIQLDLDLPSWNRLWPIFPFAAGVAFLIEYARGRNRESSRLFWGTALTLGGLLFFLITLGDQDYGVLNMWWPFFVVIGGLSFLTLWIANGFRDWGSLLLAFFGLAFGGAMLLVQLGFLTIQGLDSLWPVLLILLGLLLLARGLVGRKRSA